MKFYGRATEVAERIIEAFKHPDSLPKALAPVFIHRNDDVPCRKWSWHNQLLVALSGTTDARGIKQWRDAGRKIMKGTKALWILAPCIKTVAGEDDNGKEVERKIVYGFRGVPVFAVEDTEGEPLPGNEQYDEWVKNLPLLEVAEAWGLYVDTYSGENSGALGYFQFGGRQKIMLGVENLSTWTHELVHAADHRLSKKDEPRWLKEVVAELGGAILLEFLGQHHQADLGGAFSYIKRYSEDAGQSPIKGCSMVLDKVCNAVGLILETADKAAEENGDEDAENLPATRARKLANAG